jgi:uncharacterized protein (DUF2126 family)
MAGPGQLDMFNAPPPQEYIPSAEERARVARENKVVDPDKLVYRGGEWYYNDGVSEVELSKWRQDGEELYTKDSDYWKN